MPGTCAGIFEGLGDGDRGGGGGELLTSRKCLIRQIDYLKDHEAPIADCCEITINDKNFTKIRKILLAFLSFFYLKVIVSFYKSVAVVCPPFLETLAG